METYHFQISIIGERTPWPHIIHRTRKFKSRTKAIDLAIRAARFYNAEVRVTNGKHPLECNGSYYRSPIMKG